MPKFDDFLRVRCHGAEKTMSHEETLGRYGEMIFSVNGE